MTAATGQGRGLPTNDARREMPNRTQEFPDEEFANCLTHAAGTLLAVAAAILLMDAAADHSSFAFRLGCSVYALTMIAVYAVSTLSHSFENPARRQFFRRLDQGVIFLFIAGNFTPFAIACLHGETRWIMMAIMWAAAVVGFCSKVFWGHRVESTAVTHYLAMGWLPLTAIAPILQSLPTDGVIWCVAGGLFYTIGTVFLSFDTKVRYFHAVWHLLVIAGSACHFVVIHDYVIPLGT